MAELAKKLYFKKAGIEQTAKAYSTTAEAGTDYIENKIDGVTAYVAIGDTADSRATIGLIKENSTAVDRTILSSGKPPYNKVEYRTPGTYTVTFPAGVTTAKITLAGGGGGGGGSNYSASMSTGGNGGSGALITKTFTNIQDTLVVIVGGGGGGGYGNTTGQAGGGGGGGDSSIQGVGTAQGGDGGTGSYFLKGGNLINGTNGTSYGNGGAGGAGGKGGADGNGGAPGWVIIEYGGDI